MSQKSFSIPTLVHHKPSNQARVRIQDRDFYLGKYGSIESQERYRRLLAEWLSTGQIPTTPAESKQAAPFTIDEPILSYWKFAKGYYRKQGQPTSEQNLIRDSLKILREHYGSTAVREFGPLRLKAVREAMVQKGWCRNEINKKVGRIRRCFRWGVENELVPPEVYQGLQAITGLRKGRCEAKESSPVLPLETEEINATLPHTSPQVRDMIRLQVLAGCRPGEIVSLRPCDVNRDQEVWEYRPQSHKTEHHGRERVIFFGPCAQGILTSYLDNRPAEAPCFSPAEAESQRMIELRKRRKTKVQPSQIDRSKQKPERKPGDGYTVDSYRRAIHRACDKAKIDRWSPNRLRHTRATDLRRQFGIEAAQTILGHAELSVTQVYAERDLNSARKIMSEVG
ncbi:Site-specific tyrosine recombinase XerC [Planctomycetales bacterium 10988]|nr:Site-specific tyrosine recombinase XerC [Planctomycetales bacterium 10988]QGJ68803.1 Site-specific tyrosine recombinase XerC [Planctomycetales bacterium 10988]